MQKLQESKTTVREMEVVQSILCILEAKLQNNLVPPRPLKVIKCDAFMRLQYHDSIDSGYLSAIHFYTLQEATYIETNPNNQNNCQRLFLVTQSVQLKVIRLMKS